MFNTPGSAEFDNQALAKYTMSVTVNLTGVPAYRIRRFEAFGLCTPARTESKQRLFSDCDIMRIQEISLLERDGINLAGIKTILSLKNNLNVQAHLQK